MQWAGFTGDVFPFIVVRPKTLRIMAGTHQMDSCTGELDYLGDDFTVFPNAAQCLAFCGACHASANGALVTLNGLVSGSHMVVVVA